MVDDFEHSMSMSFRDAAHSIAKSIRDARQLIGLPPDASLNEHQTLVPVNFTNMGDFFGAPLYGPDAPAQARIIRSMLVYAGARNPAKRPQGINRVVVCNVDPSDFERVSTRFGEAAQLLAHEEDLVTRIMAASTYLDHERIKNPKIGSKLQMGFDVLPGGHVGFNLYVQTTEGSLMNNMAAAGFKYEREDFVTSDREKNIDGVQFKVKPDEVEKALAAIEKFAHGRGDTHVHLQPAKKLGAPHALRIEQRKPHEKRDPTGPGPKGPQYHGF